MTIGLRIPVRFAKLAVLLLAVLGQSLAAVGMPAYALCRDDAPRMPCGSSPRNCACAVLTRAMNQCCCSTTTESKYDAPKVSKKRSCCSTPGDAPLPPAPADSLTAAPCKCDPAAADPASVLPEMAPPSSGTVLAISEPLLEVTPLSDATFSSRSLPQTAPPPKA